MRTHGKYQWGDWMLGPETAALGGGLFVTRAEWMFPTRWEKDARGVLVPVEWDAVPQGFVFDYASVPWWARWLVAVRGKHDAAAAAHDWLYVSRRLGRRRGDLVFRELMRALGVAAWRRGIMFLAVRVGGWPGYWFPEAGLMNGKVLPSLIPSTPEEARVGAVHLPWTAPGMLASSLQSGVWLESRMWPTGEMLDQGPHPKCAGYGMANAGEAHGFLWDPDELYARAKGLDGMPDAPGTTMPAIKRATEELYGDEAELVWLRSVEEVQRFVLRRGAVGIGFDWRQGMAQPRNTWMRVRGRSWGGHFATIVGTCAKRKAFRVENTHRLWGFRRLAWLRWADLPAAVVRDEQFPALGVAKRREKDEL